MMFGQHSVLTFLPFLSQNVCAIRKEMPLQFTLLTISWFLTHFTHPQNKDSFSFKDSMSEMFMIPSHLEILKSLCWKYLLIWGKYCQCSVECNNNNIGTRKSRTEMWTLEISGLWNEGGCVFSLSAADCIIIISFWVLGEQSALQMQDLC